MNNVLYSHNSDHWETPTDIYDSFMINKYVDICPLNVPYDTPIKRIKFQNIYCNPPYSCIDKWVDICIDYSLYNNVVMLIPSRTDTKYFHKLLNHNVSLFFIKGRLRFSGKGSAPFPSVVIIFNKKRQLYFGSIDKLIYYIEGGLFFD